MRHCLLFAGVCLVGCTTKESKPGGTVVGVPSAEARTSDHPSDDVTAERQSGEAVLLGVVKRFGTKVCKSEEHEDDAEWEDPHLRAGLVRLEGATNGIESLRGEPAILFGKVTREGKPHLVPEKGNCPPIQRRSDWVSTPDGTVLQRDPAPGIASFRVRSGKRFTGLSARVEGGELVVELQNPLQVALAETAIVVHYEGCYGKPMTREERRPLGELGPGATGTAKVPLFSRQEQRSRELVHRVDSVQVSGKAADVYFDLDVRLSALGAVQKCPERP